MTSILNDEQFKGLEKDFPFLSRARINGALENLDYVVVDIETTGLEATKREIIEVAAIKGRGQTVIDGFESSIMPEKPIPREIENLTGINQEMVEGSPTAAKVLKDFIDFAGNSVLIAHYADFDMGFLKHHSKKELNHEIRNGILCTVKLSRALLPGLYNHKLHTIAGHFNLPISNRHRAMGDAEITFNVWNKLVELMKTKNINTYEEALKLM